MVFRVKKPSFLLERRGSALEMYNVDIKHVAIDFLSENRYQVYDLLVYSIYIHRDVLNKFWPLVISKPTQEKMSWAPPETC